LLELAFPESESQLQKGVSQNDNTESSKFKPAGSFLKETRAGSSVGMNA
jgi:hypothetical protein